MNNVAVFRTAKLWEIDMARDSLKQAGIPHFCREEDLSGIRTMFPAAPTPGVGVVWCLLVPESVANEAKKILAELPIDVDQQPGFLDFTSDEKVKRAFKLFIWITIIGLALVLLRGIISLFY